MVVAVPDQAGRWLTAIGADVDWSEMETSQPRLAGLGRRRLLEPGVLLVATIRGDGTPRISPVEPFVLDGILWLSMLWQSRKAADRGPACRDVAAGPRVHPPGHLRHQRGTARARQRRHLGRLRMIVVEPVSAKGVPA
jgi:hypothetical protein